MFGYDCLYLCCLWRAVWRQGSLADGGGQEDILIDGGSHGIWLGIVYNCLSGGRRSAESFGFTLMSFDD